MKNTVEISRSDWDILCKHHELLAELLLHAQDHLYALLQLSSWDYDVTRRTVDIQQKVEQESKFLLTEDEPFGIYAINEE